MKRNVTANDPLAWAIWCRHQEAMETASVIAAIRRLRKDSDDALPVL